MAMSTAIASQSAGAADYPANKITLIVGFAPGGLADTVARYLAQGMSEKLKQTVVVENRGGAGGDIAAGLVSRATPDGYTLLATTTSLAINEHIRTNKQFSAKDFQPVAITALSAESILVHPSNPANNLGEWVKAAKAKGGPVTFASPGVGSGSHIATEYFLKEIAKIPATHVPFQGGAPAINALLGNQTDIMAGTYAAGVVAQVLSGKLKALGVASEKRIPATPNVPTYAEGGFPGFLASSWVGVFAPAKTDPAIVATLNAAIKETLASPDLQEKMKTLGMDPGVGSVDDAVAMFTSEVAKWGKMVQAIGYAPK
jgi:tripartite-type tricarboxylate transporter receptor subunit TctC